MDTVEDENVRKDCKIGIETSRKIADEMKKRARNDLKAFETAQPDGAASNSGLLLINNIKGQNQPQKWTQPLSRPSSCLLKLLSTNSIVAHFDSTKDCLAVASNPVKRVFITSL